MYRKILCALALLSAALTTPAMAQSAAPDTQKMREAYEIANRCLVADGLAYNNRQEAHDDERANYYHERFLKAFKAVENLRTQLGYSDDQLAADKLATMNREMPLLMWRSGYFDKTADLCKAYGLM